MSGTIAYSISLEKQPTWTIYKESPSSEELSLENKYVDSSEWEEYSFTGFRPEIEQQRATELASGNGWQVQATQTRLNGEIWELKIRKSPILLREDDDEDISQEEQEALESKYGSVDKSKQTSIDITAIQESILNHDKYKDIPPDNLGAIRMYMNGSGAGEKIGTSMGTLRLDDLMHLTDPLVQLAIKNPTFYVPSMSVTYSYWKAQKQDDISDIGTRQKPKGVDIPEGYISLLMGRSSSPVEKGYRIEESFLIGKFNPELYPEQK